MNGILEGVRHFRDTVFEEKRELFQSLAKGQSPQALFITCCDSRIDPCLITQTGPGDLFVHRNVGNIIPPYGTGSGEEATIEYAMEVLEVPHIIICGHRHCGAMAALVANENEPGRMPSIPAWLRHAERVRESLPSDELERDPRDFADRAVRKNVLVQMANLCTHPSVANRLADGRVRLHGWVYDFETADFQTHDPTTGTFRFLLES